MLVNASKRQEILECSSLLLFTACIDLCKKPPPKLQGSASTYCFLEKKFKDEARLQFSTIKTFWSHWFSVSKGLALKKQWDVCNTFWQWRSWVEGWFHIFRIWMNEFIWWFVLSLKMLFNDRFPFQRAEDPCAIKFLIRLLSLMHANTFSRCDLCLCHHLNELYYLFPSSFAMLTGFIGRIFIFPEIENFELHVSIFINVSTMKNKVKRDSNWAEILLVKQSLKNNHLN